MLYDWGVHLLDQILWMMPGVKIQSVYADLRNVINKEVDDYFKIMMRFENGIMAEVELGTYFLTDKMHDKWFERHWFVGGNKGSAYVDGFFPEGKIVRTTKLLTNAGGSGGHTARRRCHYNARWARRYIGGKGRRTAAPARSSFGPPPEGRIVTEPLPTVNTRHEDYFENYKKAYRGEGEFLVKIPETRRVLRLMEAVRESARTGESVRFE